MKVILTGSIAIDYLMKFPGLFSDHLLPEHLDKVSLSFLVPELSRRDGGVGANIAYTLAMLGGKACLFSTAGQDFPEYAKRLEAVGVDTSSVRIIPEKFTASFFATTDQHNAQIASFYTGAMADSANLSLKEAPYDCDDFVMISPTDPSAMARYIEEALELCLKTLFDPGQQVISVDADLLRRGLDCANGLFVNEYEFELMQKHTGYSETELLAKPVFSVITLGERGVRVNSAEGDIYVPALTGLNIVDPTGVGDAFRGGFLRGYLAGLSLKTCAEMGTVTAAACIQQNGTQVHHFTWDEFVTEYRKHFDDQGELDTIGKSK
ncbi:MAG: carbohydrate kinase family protein [Chloroflexi bacterium]|nr:carbohydrate kinase family protein [Chloroflexota bacterium]